MEKVRPNKRPFNLTHLFGRLCLVLVAVTFCFCTSGNRPTICGVPVQGNPWQLAASIQTDGDKSFQPQCVDLVTSTKAYISGYLLPDEQPATLICDLSDKGEVCSAVLHCETLDKSE